MAKIRLGFVSNSSSSSFICCLSGEEMSGYDISLSDCGMVRCFNGHVIMEEYKLESKDPSIKELKKWLKDWIENWPEHRSEHLEALKLKGEDFREYFNDNLEDEYEENINEDGFPPAQCPVCTFVDLPYEEIAKWYLKSQGISRKEMAQRMKAEFGGDYNKFSEYIKVEEDKNNENS